jgi:sulfotransferase family protein
MSVSGGWLNPSLITRIRHAAGRWVRLSIPSLTQTACCRSPRGLARQLRSHRILPAKFVRPPLVTPKTQASLAILIGNSMELPKDFPGHRRLVLLIGSPRSGTTWLAKILDTSPEVMYIHEPLKSFRLPLLQRPPHQFDCGILQPDQTAAPRTALSKIELEWLRPPFFPKAFLHAPPWLRTFGWSLPRLLGRELLLRHCFTPMPGWPYDLLVKEVEWQGCLPQLTEYLKPDHLIILFRHPCAVVNSRLMGLRLGMMDSFRSGWIERYGDRCNALGFAADRVEAMEMYEFFALRWLVSALEQLELAKAHHPATMVVYEDLCKAPEHTVRDLFAVLNWQLTDETERFIRRSTTPGTWTRWCKLMKGKRAYYWLYHDPATASAAWRKNLTSQQQQRILAITASFPHMDWWASVDAVAHEATSRRIATEDRDDSRFSSVPPAKPN